MPLSGASRREHIELRDAHRNYIPDSEHDIMVRASESSLRGAIETPQRRNSVDDMDMANGAKGESKKLEAVSVNVILTYCMIDSRRLLFKLGASFFLFGLINNGEHLRITPEDTFIVLTTGCSTSALCHYTFRCS